MMSPFVIVNHNKPLALSSILIVFENMISQDPNAGGSRDGGLRVMTDLLTAFPKIDAVVAINDPTAIGCDLAAIQANRKDFYIVGIDGSPDVVPFLKDPNCLIAATA